MADRPFTVVGDGNFSGSSFTNIGNRTIYNIYAPERKIFTLESRVSFDALLTSEARYPAPKCHPATRKAAQKVVKNWLCRKGEGSEKGIMWMSGAPGVGKSAIAQTVSEELCGDDGSASWLSRIVYRDRYIDGCFFFGRGFENRENASFFPATIAFQLRRSRTSCRTAIDKAIEKRPEIFSEDLPSQFRYLLTKAAQSTGFLQGPITVVVDGLDECNSIADQVTLLELILGAVKAGNMRFFIASRPEQHIDAFFHRQDASQHTYHVRLDEETFKTSQDIKVFLREEFARIRKANPEACLRLPNGEEWPGERVLDQLTVEFDSQFMLPTLTIGFIDTPFFPPDKQLRILLEAPPSGAFSALDTMYHRILSRRPPAHLVQGEDDLREYQEVVMGILRVIIAWSGAPLSAAKIATILDKPYDVVQSIVRGPMRTLFKFHTSEPDSPITLCHKSLRDYLLDRKRSEEFFIPSAEEDDLFIAILSRHPTSHGIVMDVLSCIYQIAPLQASQPLVCTAFYIAAFLNVDSSLVEDVVSIGPTSVLFEVKGDKVKICTYSFEYFLQNADRSGPFFLYPGRADTLLIQALSRQPPSESLYSYSTDVVLDILATVIGYYTSWKVPITKVAALLEVDSRLVEHVVTFGPAKWIVDVDEHGNIRTKCGTASYFLRDAGRSGEYFINERRLDPIFTRILSQQTPSDLSHPSYRDTLMGILTVLTCCCQQPGGEVMDMYAIASVLGVNHTLVESVVTLMSTHLLFNVDQNGVGFSFAAFFGFLFDSDRSGAFFISDRRVNTFFIQTLSRQPPSDPSNLYSRDTLLDILAATQWGFIISPSIYRIAAVLDLDSSLVEHVVKFGPEKWLFSVDKHDEVGLSGYDLPYFLQDADLSGEFFISNRRLDPHFVRILEQQPPSDPLHSEASSHDVLLRVLTAIIAFQGRLSTLEIASAIGVDPVLVEGVVEVEPAKVLLVSDLKSRVNIPWRRLIEFLQDSTRSGKSFIPQSSIDALFIHVLSDAMTSPRGAYPYSQDTFMDVLTAKLMAEGTSGISLCRIAGLLDVDPGVVEGVVFGAAKKLFDVVWLDEPIPSANTFLNAFLRDADRAGDFCITEKRIDSFFTRILHRLVPPKSSHSHARGMLTSILNVMAHSPKGSTWTVSSLAAFLDVDPTLVEGIVNTGPSRVLFWFSDFPWKYGHLISPLLWHFMMDANRSAEFDIGDNSLDPFFTRILSSPPPATGSPFEFLDILKNVLAVTLALSPSLSVNSAGAALDVDPGLVDSVIRAGSTRPLFAVEWLTESFAFSTDSLPIFLRDPERSGEHYISDGMIDALFIRILTLPPPPYFSHPYIKNVLLGAMTLVMSSPVPLTALKMSTLLNVDRSLVDGVLEIIPAKVLFTIDEDTHEVGFSGPFFKLFLQDANRSGEFFIPPTAALDDIPKPWLHHPSDSSEVSGGDDEEGDEMKEKSSTKGKDPERWQEIADMGTLSQGPAHILPASIRSKRKISRLASSRQGSRDSTSEIATSPTVRAKRPKTRGSLVLDSEEPQGLYGSDSDTEEAMISEAMVVDDEEIWGSEAVGDPSLTMVQGGSGMDVDRKDNENDS